MVSVDQFKRCFPANPHPAEWTAALAAVLPNYGITSPLRLASFLAQCGHESDGFTDITECLNYSSTALAATWPNRYAVNPKAAVKEPNDLAKRLHRRPEAIANNCYAGRMGNGDEASGDGWKFRGRGCIQVTGRSNYTAFAKCIGRSLDDTIAYLETREGAVESACWFWSCNCLNGIADRGDIVKITEKINGGHLGLKDRMERYETIKRTLGIT